VEELVSVGALADGEQVVDGTGVPVVSPGDWITIRVKLTVPAPVGTRLFLYVRYADGEGCSPSDDWRGIIQPSDELTARFRLWGLAAPGLCSISALSLYGSHGEARKLIKNAGYPLFVVREPAVALAVAGIDVAWSPTLEPLASDAEVPDAPRTSRVDDDEATVVEVGVAKRKGPLPWPWTP
jgi:hypothetical protein